MADPVAPEADGTDRDVADADGALLVAVSLALTGERIAVRPPAGADGPRAVVAALARAGWDAERLQEVRRGAQAGERAWPFPVPRELLVAAGFARFGATLAEVRALLGLDGLVPTVHRGPRVLGPAEKRLLADVPPHHGSAG